MQMRLNAALAAALVVLAGCDGSAGDARNATAEVQAPAFDPALAAHLPQGVPIEVAERGRDLYPTCGVCHGMEGEGTQLGPRLADAEWIHGSGAVPEIAALIRSGVQDPSEYPIPMPVLGGGDFDDADVQALATYVYLLSRSASPPPPASSDSVPVDTAAPGTAPPDTATPTRRR